MPLSTMEVSSYGQRSICYVAVYGHPLYVIQLIDRPFPRYGYTHIPLHAASYCSCLQSWGQFLNVHPGSYVWWLHWQGWVNSLVSALMLCAKNVRICCSARQSAGIRSALTWRRWLCIHDVLVRNSRGR